MIQIQPTEDQAPLQSRRDKHAYTKEKTATHPDEVPLRHQNLGKWVRMVYLNDRAILCSRGGIYYALS